MDEMTMYVNVAQDKHSIERLEKVLLGVDGIERALVDTDDGEVKISFTEEKLTRKDIVNKIKENGFDVLP